MTTILYLDFQVAKRCIIFLLFFTHNNMLIYQLFNTTHHRLLLLLFLQKQRVFYLVVILTLKNTKSYCRHNIYCNKQTTEPRKGQVEVKKKSVITDCEPVESAMTITDYEPAMTD